MIKSTGLQLMAIYYRELHGLDNRCSTLLEWCSLVTGLQYMTHWYGIFIHHG